MHICNVGMPLSAWGVYRKGVQFYLAVVMAIFPQLLEREAPYFSHNCSWKVLEGLSKTKDTTIPLRVKINLSEKKNLN